MRRNSRLPDGLKAILKLLQATLACVQACPILEHDNGLSLQQRTKLLDAIDIYEARTMNPDESLAAEAFFHLRHGCANEVGIISGVQTHVIAVRLDPVDFL